VRTTAADTDRGVTALQWDNWGEKQSVCPVGELTPQASAVCSSQLPEVTRAGLSSCCSWSPPVSWEAGSCWGRVLRFQRVILHGEAGSGMHSHLREAGLTWLWWIQGEISATLTVVGVDKITIKGPSSGILMVGHFIILFFYPDNIFFNWVELPWQQYIVSIYMSKKTHC
jgi:hypothetical protein